MVDAIILSKDRPAQLELCLRSIMKNSRNIFKTLTVLYTFSDNDFLLGYEVVKNMYPNVFFVTQRDYHNELDFILTSNGEYTCFFTDDDIFYRSINEEEEKDLMEVFEFVGDLAGFSLRLGLNTSVQDPYNNTPTIPPTNGFIGWERIILWDWASCPPYMNFGYPLSVDGHIFPTEVFQKISDQFKYQNPNQQEVAMQSYNSSLEKTFGAFKQSCVVNTPLNRVQEVCLNRSGETFGKSVLELNRKFLDGFVLDLDSIDFSNIVGCHQELDIKWATM